MPQPTEETERAEGTALPMFEESLAGALIDSARISVMAATALLPHTPHPAPLIILPGTEEQQAEDAACTVEGCLEQAMQWLDAARGFTVLAGAPVTSLHAVAGRR